MNLNTVRIVVAALSVGIAGAALAQSFPDRPVRLVVPFAPGGGMDIPARLIVEPMAKALGQPIVVENRPGANATIGAATVVTAPPDGYTVLFSILSSLTRVFNKDLSFDATTDLVPVGGAYGGSFVLFSTAAIPPATLKELVEYAKARPGKLNYASTALTAMLATEMLKSMAAIDVVAVSYKGGAPGRAALLANEVQIHVNIAPIHRADVEAGKARALAVLGPKRVATLPNVPTSAEAGYPDLVSTNTAGIWAPKGTPPAAIQKLNAALNEALKDPKFAQFAETSGGAVYDGRTPEAYARVSRDEIAFWTRAAKLANYQPQ